MRGRLLALFLTLALPLIVVTTSGPDAWLSLWTLFGSANQLLAALSLLAVSMWLLQSNKPAWVTLVPMTFVLVITLWSLIQGALTQMMVQELSIMGVINSVVAFVLVALALYIVAQAAIQRNAKGAKAVKSAFVT